MRSYVSNWMSLRKKITGLAFIPALIISIVFGALIWAARGPRRGWWGRS